MRQLRVGIAGFGFVGPHHLDAIRPLGFAAVTAIATSSKATARAKAAAYGIGRAYGDWRELVDDPELDVIDIATPTHLHAPIALAAIRSRKHVIVDKPMSLTSAEARAMLVAAERTGVVHALTFNIRYHAMLQQARTLVAAGSIGEVRFIRGHYLQEWLLKDTDFNWRIDPAMGGPLAMVADAGAHWYDLAQHLTGRRIVRVLADLASFIPVRRRPVAGGREAFSTGAAGRTERFAVRVPDLGTVLMQFDNGARGQFAASALCAGHKNDLTIEICGAKASLRWEQERPDELWIGHRDAPSQLARKDPALLDRKVRPYAGLPGGHAEGWSAAFRNLMRNILTFIAEARDPREADEAAFPTFRTGLEIARLTDAIAASARAGGRWKTVPHHRRGDRS